MKKINILSIILDLIFLIVFNAVVFLLTNEYTPAFWISYVFINFSYIMMIMSPVFMPKTKNVAVFGYPVAYISFVYFLVEFFTGIFFLTIGKYNTKYAFIVQLIVTGFYGVTFISNLIANERTIEDEGKRQEEIMYIKMAILEVDSIMKQIKDSNLRKKVEKVYDALRSSQVRTYPELYDIENDIDKNITSLDRAVKQNLEDEINNIIYKILKLIDERNQKIKSLY